MKPSEKVIRVEGVPVVFQAESLEDPVWCRRLTEWLYVHSQSLEHPDCGICKLNHDLQDVLGDGAA